MSRARRRQAGRDERDAFATNGMRSRRTGCVRDERDAFATNGERDAFATNGMRSRRTGCVRDERHYSCESGAGISVAALYLQVLPSLVRVMLPESNSCLRRFCATRMETPVLAATSRESIPFGLEPTNSSSSARSASMVLLALACVGRPSSESVSRTAAGECVSTRSGVLDKSFFQTRQMFWSPLPARSLAPMNDRMRMSVGFLVSDTPPAMATFRSTSRLPGFETSSFSSVRTTLTVHESP